MAYTRIKFINATLYVIASYYSMSELKIISQKNLQLTLLQKGNGQYFLGKMALLPLFGERFAHIIPHP
jgi:hypothetical protein